MGKETTRGELYRQASRELLDGERRDGRCTETVHSLRNKGQERLVVRMVDSFLQILAEKV